MKTDNYIIVASDHDTILSRIVTQLNQIEDYSVITINSIQLLKQLLETISPKLVVLYFKNNWLSLNELYKFKTKFISPVLCLTNRYEELHSIPKNIPLLIQSLENSLENNYLYHNVKSILLIKQMNGVKVKNISKSFHNDKSLLKQEKNVARYILELDQKKALLKKIMERMKELSMSVDIDTRKRLNAIVNNIKLNTKTNHWEDFKVYFESVNPGFIKQLHREFPCLTAKDIKYCCYLKMNMSNEDIRYILGINKESVRTHKYRLKKKMTLEREQDLRTFISSF